jgi:hypothetical protein
MNNKDPVPDIVIAPREVKDIDPKGVVPKINVGDGTTRWGERRGVRTRRAAFLESKKLQGGQLVRKLRRLGQQTFFPEQRTQYSRH